MDVARVGIALLCAGAVVLIVVILNSGHYDDVNGRVAAAVLYGLGALVLPLLRLIDR